MYLATGEDERRCDDLPVFDKCVFHLVGERSTDEKKKKSARGSRGGEQRSSEGRREAVRGNQAHKAERDTDGGSGANSVRLKE